MAYKKKIVKGARRRLNALRGGPDPTMKAAQLAVEGAIALNNWSKTSKGLRGFKSNQPKSKTSAMLRSNDSGYIRPHSFKSGTFKTSLSLKDKLDRHLNPPQTFSWTTNGKLETTSAVQGVSGFTVNNNFLNVIFGEYPNLRTESAVADTAYPVAGSHSKLNHLYTSIIHTFMNSSNLCAELSIYTYKSKNDIESSDQPVTASGAWSYAESINQLIGSNGNIDLAGGTTLLGKSPTNVSAKAYISRYWGLIDKCSVTMKPGESFKHNGIVHLNKVIAQYMLHGDTNSSVKDHCLSMIFVVKGQVIGSSTTGAISTGDAQISYIRQLKMAFCTATQSKPRDVIIGNDVVAVPVANQVFINTDTGAQVTAYTEDA